MDYWRWFLYQFLVDKWLPEWILSSTDFSSTNLTSRLADVIKEGKWVLPTEFFIYFPQLQASIEAIILPKVSCVDKLVWITYRDGDLSLKESYDFFRVQYLLKPWCDQVWKDFIPTKFSMLVWRMLQNRLPTDEIFWGRGICVVSTCLLCDFPCCCENVDHIFVHCKFASGFTNGGFGS